MVSTGAVGAPLPQQLAEAKAEAEALRGAAWGGRGAGVWWITFARKKVTTTQPPVR